MIPFVVYHLVSPTYRIAYEFEFKNIDKIEYVGIYYSYREDENDEWGEDWGKKEKKKEYDAIMNRHAMFYTDDTDELHQDLDALENKYNPVMNKTSRGETRFSGCHFRCYSEKPKCLVPIEDIKSMFIDKLKSELKVQL
jgi:hypothetical protein